MVKMYNYINVNQQYYPLENKKICIWGRSVSALTLYVELQNNGGVNIIGFTDSFAKGNETFAGLPVYTYSEIQCMDNLAVYISTVNEQYQREILEQTENLKGIDVLCRTAVYGPGCYDIAKLGKMIEKDHDEIEEVKKSLCDKKSVDTFENLLKYRVCNDAELIKKIYESGHKQYFPVGEFLPVCQDEVFVDAGGYNGETSYQFAQWTGDNYLKIYILEPDRLMAAVTREYIKLKNLKNVILVNKGAYSCETELSFHSDFISGSSHITTDGEKSIQTVSIDGLLAGDRASFIKMDIEGAEIEALIGAEKTIEQYRPKLAISVYHNEDDLWKIPYYIKKRYPWYKLYMRHYTTITTETVLYAVEDEGY